MALLKVIRWALIFIIRTCLVFAKKDDSNVFRDG